MLLPQIILKITIEKLQFNISYVIYMPFVCHSYLIRISSICTRMSFVCHSFVLIYNGMSLVCTRTSSVCHSCVLVCHLYVTRMYAYAICMSSYVLACHSYVLVRHSYVTRMLFFHEPVIRTPCIQGNNYKPRIVIKKYLIATISFFSRLISFMNFIN